MKNEFALGKLRPAKGWKKEYHRRHAESNDHARFAPQATAISRTACAVFKTPRLFASERETIGLLFNIYFLTTNGLSMIKGAPLHSLVDFQFLFQEQQEDLVSIDVDVEEQPSTAADGELHNPLSKTHRSTYSTWEFVHALNAVTETGDVGDLQNARYFSLLLDESNDIVCGKNLLIYYQFLDVDRKKVELKFMKLVALQECDADSIFKSVVKYFDDVNVHLTT